jgi:hypothetical protein
MMVLVGEGWQKTIETFLTEFSNYLHMHDQKRVYFAADIQSAVALLNQLEIEQQQISQNQDIKNGK